MLGSLQRNAYRLPSDSIWTVPQAVSQPPTGDITSQTQWSAKYNREKPPTGHLARVREKIRLQDKPLIRAFPMEVGRKPCLRILQSLQRILMTEKKTPLQVLTFGLQGSF